MGLSRGNSFYCSCAIIALSILMIINTFAFQQLKQEVTVVNVAVPVHVFYKDRFVDNLTIQDFEVYENGVRQEIEAVYLIRKTAIQRSYIEQNGGEKPKIQMALNIRARHFVFLFEMDEYMARLGKAIDMFFSEVLLPGDFVLAITPIESWTLKIGTPDQKARKSMAESFNSRLRKSLILSARQLRSLLMDLRHYADEIDSGDFGATMRAREALNQIISLKTTNERRFANFADSLKLLSGQKHVILFYQYESFNIPAHFKRIWEEDVVNRKDFVDPEKIRRLFSDAATTIHFLYLKKSDVGAQDVEFQKIDSSYSAKLGSDFYQAFRELASITGGVIETTANPPFALKKALDASENYYLLYYRPANYKADGSVKEIKVKVKGQGFQVTHRTGYVQR